MDLNRETPITFRAAAQHPLFRRDGRPRHPSQIYRYAATGIRGIRLEYVQQAGIRVTSVQAIERFFDGLREAPHA